VKPADSSAAILSATVGFFAPPAAGTVGSSTSSFFASSSISLWPRGQAGSLAAANVTSVQSAPTRRSAVSRETRPVLPPRIVMPSATSSWCGWPLNRISTFSASARVRLCHVDALPRAG
jgi:hypothetical protein